MIQSSPTKAPIPADDISIPTEQIISNLKQSMRSKLRELRDGYFEDGTRATREKIENAAHNLSVDEKSGINLDWTTQSFPILEEVLAEKCDGEPTLHTVSASEFKMIKTQWFLPNRIPIPAFGILQGEGGIGKTTVVFDLIARASRGGQLPDGSAGIGVLKTVLFATEDTTSRIGAQLKAAKADLTNIIFVPWVDTTEGRTSFTLPTHASALENIVVRTGARLVYIDSLFDTFAEGLDTNNARDVRSALGPLRDVAKNTGCVILATRHVTKAIGRASVRGMGSGDIGNLARFVFQVAPHPQDPTIKLLSEVKKNSGRPCDSLAFRIDDVELLLDEGQVEDVSVITWIGTDATTADEAALGLSSKRDQAKEKILEALRQGEVKSEELMKQIGCSRGTFFKAKADLISEGHNIHARKTGMSGGWLWKLLGGPAEESHA